jgi:osmoprotectant transport system permease protein
MTLLADQRLVEAVDRLPDYLGNHILVSLTALALGLAVSLPLAVLSIRRPRLRVLLLALSSIVQTIPGLALLALFYPVLIGLSALSHRLFGVSFSALGFLPSVLALTMYSTLPVLRNTVTGLVGIDPAVSEAARGVGMTRRQALLMVELPLAFPVIMAGIRTAAVWVIGTATLATPIGQTSLGNYIFTGLQTQNWIFVLFGCVAAAVLALAVDQLLAMVEDGVARRRRARVAMGALGLALLVTASLVPSLSHAPSRYVIGAKPFTEQYILAALIEQRLRAAGLTATRREGLGSNVIFRALSVGEVDVYVDYSGTIWANQMGRSDTKPRAVVFSEVDRWLRGHGITLLGELGFENAYALAMTAARAEALGVRSVSDLAQHVPTLSIAGDYEFFGRSEWKALEAAYGLRFREYRQMQPEFMYMAAERGDVDVISAYSSEGRLASPRLRVLEEPKQAIPPYDAILLIAPQRAGDRALRAALQPLIGAIDIGRMREANLAAARGDSQTTIDETARRLWKEIERGAALR